MQTSVARNSHGGEFDDREVPSPARNPAREQAQLLGFSDHAAYQFDGTNPGKRARRNKLLGDLAPPAVAKRGVKPASCRQSSIKEHGGFQVSRSDRDFCAEKVRQARYAFDESELRPYFELNHVLVNGLLYAATELYGITFKERHDLPPHHPDAHIFEVFQQRRFRLSLCS